MACSPRRYRGSRGPDCPGERERAHILPIPPPTGPPSRVVSGLSRVLVTAPHASPVRRVAHSPRERAGGTVGKGGVGPSSGTDPRGAGRRGEGQRKDGQSLPSPARPARRWGSLGPSPTPAGAKTRVTGAGDGGRWGYCTTTRTTAACSCCCLYTETSR